MLRIFLIAALLAGSAALADDAPRASINYSKLADYQKRMDGLRDLDQLTVSARLGSKDANVKPADITLSAKLGSGQVVDIPIAADGAFTLPASPELEKEDPLFVSNQPKGTLQLDIKFDVKTPMITVQRYKALMLSAVQFNQAIGRQGMMASLFGPKAGGLIFVFDDGGHSLTLHTRAGDRVLKSGTLAEARKHLQDMTLTDKTGKSSFLYLPLDDDLMDEDPQTVFDALPTGAIPAI